MLSFAVALLVSAATWSDLLQCRQHSDNSTRLACYDLVINSVEDNAVVSAMATDARQSDTDEPAELKPAEELTSAADNAAETAFGLRLADRARPVSLTSKVVSVSRSAHKKWILGLDNQQMWRQLDNATLVVEVGDVVNIRRGRAGSFLLAKATGGVAMRVLRIR